MHSELLYIASISMLSKEMTRWLVRFARLLSGAAQCQSKITELIKNILWKKLKAVSSITKRFASSNCGGYTMDFCLVFS